MSSTLISLSQLAATVFTIKLKLLLRSYFGTGWQVLKNFISPSLFRYFSDPPQQMRSTPVPSVSIVIPTYNGTATLSRLLESIHKQQKVEIKEIIFVDSGSSDTTIHIATTCPKSQLVQVSSETFNHGLTRNLAASKATAPYVLFLVQDVELTDSLSISSLVSVLEQHSNCAVVSLLQTPTADADAYAFFENMTLYHGQEYHQDYRLSRSANFDRLTLPQKRDLTFQDNVCALYRRDVFVTLNGFREVHHAEDVEFASRAITHNYDVGLRFHPKVSHSHVRPFQYVLKRNYVGYRQLWQQLELPSSTKKHPAVILHSATWALEQVGKLPSISGLQLLRLLFSQQLSSLGDSEKNYRLEFMSRIIASFMFGTMTLPQNMIQSRQERLTFLVKVIAAETGKQLALSFTSMNLTNQTTWQQLDNNLSQNI